MTGLRLRREHRPASGGPVSTMCPAARCPAERRFNDRPSGRRALHLGHLLLCLGLVAAEPAAWAQPAGSGSLAAAENAIVGPGLYVGDIQRSLKFYRDILGMTVRMQYGPADKPDVVIGFGSDPTQAGLMLLSDRTAPTPRKIQHGHGYDRVAIRLADLQGAHAKLRAAGHTVSDIRVVHDVFLMAMATDPDGYKVELLGPKPPK